MDTINEVALKERVTLGNLLHFQVVELEFGKFQLLCHFMWQEAGVLLITQRRKPRTWSSLDSLYDYIDKTYGSVPTIFLRNLPENYAHAFTNGIPDSEDSSEAGGLVD